MKPFLKWAGGKRQLLLEIKKYINNETMPEGVNYYEPFIGGGSLFFELARKNSVINDYNSEIINTYKVIKDNPKELIKLLNKHKKNDSVEYFYQIRNMDRLDNFNRIGKIKKAARTIYLNRTCFNGLYRVNSKGFFNTPRGKYTNPLICDQQNIFEISKFLNENNIKILNVDFEHACPGIKSGDIVYFDPPYDYENEDGFVSYNANGFSRKDLLRLKLFSEKLIKMGCNILISNNDTSFVRETFSGDNYEIIYQFNEVEANRNINSSAKQRSSKVKELLIYGTKK